MTEVERKKNITIRINKNGDGIKFDLEKMLELFEEWENLDDEK